MSISRRTEVIPADVQAKGPAASKKWSNAACNLVPKRPENSAFEKLEAEVMQLRAEDQAVKAKLRALKVVMIFGTASARARSHTHFVVSYELSVA